MKKKPLTILIDSGNTHNFLDLRAVALLNCELELTNKLLVIVADGNRITSDAKCSTF